MIFLNLLLIYTNFSIIPKIIRAIEKRIHSRSNEDLSNKPRFLQRSLQLFDL